MDFRERLLELIDIQYDGNKKKFANATGIPYTSVVEYTTGVKKDPKLSLINKIQETVENVNATWLTSGKGMMITLDTSTWPLGVQEGVKEGGAINTVNDPESTYFKKNVHSEIPKVITVDITNNEVIPITNIKAAAGGGYVNTEELTSEDVIKLPNHMLKAGNHLCIRIKGNSMAPTLQDGGYVVVKLIERSEWQYIPDERIYIVVDIEGMTYLKRVKNRFDQGFVVLCSDNPDKPTYPNFNLQESEIMSIWYVEWYMSAKMPNVHDQFYSKVSRLEDGLDQLTQEFSTIKRKFLDK
jgi:phage repressor protein C with HTH and peptisase S24 domain